MSIKHQRALSAHISVCSCRVAIQLKNETERPAMKTDGIERSKLNQQLKIHCGTDVCTNAENGAAHKTPTSSNHIALMSFTSESHRIIAFSQSTAYYFCKRHSYAVYNWDFHSNESSSMRIELVIFFALPAINLFIGARTEHRHK
jgi:hypothetical protein